MFDFLKKMFGKKSKTEINSELIEIVIPEPQVAVISDKVEFPKSVYSFDEIVDFQDDKFRIRSENSKEVVRLYVTEMNNVFKRINLTSKCMYMYYKPAYLDKVEKTAGVWRLFITDEGRMFYQMIWGNGKVKYITELPKDIRADLEKWETNRECMRSESNFYDVYSPGKHREDNLGEKKTMPSYTVEVDRYEIKDEELYNKLIEIY